MKSQLPRRLGTLGAVLILGASSACSGDGKEESEGSDVAESENGDGTIELDFGPGTFDLADTTVGLADLSSYKATLTLTFDGTQDGQAQQWSTTFEMIRTRDPEASQLNVKQTGTAAEGDPQLPQFIAEINGVRYEQLAETGCTVAIADSANSLLGMLEPAGQLRTVFGASTAGQEAVNGIDAEKFTFDESALGRSGISDSTGEILVSSEGGYVVSYVLRATGDGEFFGEGVEGTMTWDYKLSDVNQSLAVELPEDCPAGLISAPTFADATNVLSVPGLLQYETAGSVADLKAFYETELAALGWTVPVSDPPAGVSAEEYQQLLIAIQEMGLDEPTDENPNEAALRYEQSDEQLTVIITMVGSVTQVQLFLTR